MLARVHRLAAQLLRQDTPRSRSPTRSTPRCRRPSRSGLTVLDKSAAEDKNSIAVTKETADASGPSRRSPTSPRTRPTSRIAAPPEFKTRQQGLVGLKSVYNLVPERVPAAAEPGRPSRP